MRKYKGVLTYDAWAIVVQEIQARRDELDGVLDAGKVMQLSDVLWELQKLYREDKTDD